MANVNPRGLLAPTTTDHKASIFLHSVGTLFGWDTVFPFKAWHYLKDGGVVSLNIHSDHFLNPDRPANVLGCAWRGQCRFGQHHQSS